MNLTIFDVLYPKYKIDKPIRLIECFGGIGSQAKALQNLEVNFEHYKYIDFDKYAVASYNTIFNTNFVPTDIIKIKADDLEITNTDKYCYIMTYSFPCQDLSKAGHQKGMSKGNNTRSGLLWEVERLINECKELPQVLLMENVPDVIGSKNINDFNEWQLSLEKLGYKNYVQCLNAKDYEIPQNRNRCFMVSILGDYSYTFPEKKKLKLRLKDMLEDEVGKKYYLSEKTINTLVRHNNKIIFNNNPLLSCTLQAGYYKMGGRDQQYIKVLENTKKGYAIAKDGDGVYINRPHQKRGVVQKQMIQTIKTSNDDLGVVVNPLKGKTKYGWHFEQNVYSEDSLIRTLKSSEGSGNKPKIILNNLRIRKLTPLECWRLMGFEDLDFYKASTVNSNSQLYKQAGNSICVPVLENIFRQLL